jgi:membrane fusion protein (multidrug efflux system)
MLCALLHIGGDTMGSVSSPFLFANVLQSSLLGLSTLFLALNLSGCHSGENEKPHPKLRATSPMVSNQIVTKEYVAQISAIQHIELRAFERGYLQEIFVDEGQLIKKGEPMFKIMPALNEAEFHKAKAEADLARIEYRNTQDLAKKNVVSPNELALSKAKYDKAKAELELASIHLNFTEIKAPFDGLMDRFRVRLGSLLEEGELLTTLSDNSEVWVYFNVSESDYLDFKSKDNDVQQAPVRLKLANGKLFDQKGKIDTIEADFNNETGNIAFRASFPNPDGLLRHGETGNILLQLPLENVLVIPQKATFEILDKRFVYLVNKKGEVESRQIQVAEELEHIFVIESGLKETDKILLEGLAEVRKGDHVEIDYQDPKLVLTHLDIPTE